jgi:hypothetical protein
MTNGGLGRRGQRPRLSGVEAGALLRACGGGLLARSHQEGRLRDLIDSREDRAKAMESLGTVLTTQQLARVARYLEATCVQVNLDAYKPASDSLQYLHATICSLQRAARRSTDSRIRRRAGANQMRIQLGEHDVRGVRVAHGTLQQYPGTTATVQCTIGRTPMNSMEADVVVTGRKFMVTEKNLVTDQAGGVRQSRVEVRRLLARTARWFPSEAKARAVRLVVVPPALEGAVRQVGWGMIGRAKFSRMAQRVADMEEWVAALSCEEVPTVTAAASVSKVYVFSNKMGQTVVECLSSHQWASLLGVPVCIHHPLRLCISSVTDAEGSALVGQAVDVDVAKQIIVTACARVGVKLDGTEEIKYASMLSAIDFFAGALFDLVGKRRLVYLAAAEAAAKVLSAHAAGWGGMVSRVFGYVQAAETRRSWAQVAGQATVVTAGLRCAPWSRANRTNGVETVARQEQIAAALREDQLVVDLLLQPAVQVAILETSDGILGESMAEAWGQMQRIFGRHGDFDWVRHTVCPVQLLGKCSKRRRLYIVGTRKRVVGGVMRIEEGGSADTDC